MFSTKITCRRNQRKKIREQPAILYSLTHHMLQVPCFGDSWYRPEPPLKFRQKPTPPLQHKPSPLVVVNVLREANGYWDPSPHPWIFAVPAVSVFWRPKNNPPLPTWNGAPKSLMFSRQKKRAKFRSLAKGWLKFWQYKKKSTKNIKGLRSSVTT